VSILTELNLCWVKSLWNQIFIVSIFTESNFCWVKFVCNQIFLVSYFTESKLCLVKPLFQHSLTDSNTSQTELLWNCFNYVYVVDRDKYVKLPYYNFTLCSDKELWRYKGPRCFISIDNPYCSKHLSQSNPLPYSSSDTYHVTLCSVLVFK